MTKRVAAAACTAAIISLCVAGTVRADPQWRGGPEHPGPGDHHAGPGDHRAGPPRHGPPPGAVHREHRRPPPRADWQRGRWQHTVHNGRRGWWWVVGGSWVFYSQPVYPYPAYAYTPPPMPAGPATSYYCYNPPGYYPTVPACPEGWYATPAP